MKIAVISSALPVHPHSVFGIHKRLDMFIEAIKAMGELDMLFFVKPDLNGGPGFAAEMKERLTKHWKADLRLDLCSMASVRPMQGFWQEYIRPALRISDHFPYLLTAQAEQIGAVRRLLSRKPDILFVHRLACMIPVVLAGVEPPQTYFDMDDVEHLAFVRSIKQPPLWRGKPLLHLRVPLLRRWERKALSVSQAAFVCSERDRRYLSRLYRAKNVVVVPNAVDIPAAYGVSDKPTLLFLGFLSYAPNTVAADYLIKRVWPLILSAVPQSTLLIAGAHPDRLESFAESPPGVEFLGFVDNMEKLYQDVRVVCCPILSGGGTRIKILEAAAHGKPVVSTTIGAEGIDMRDGEEILLRDNPSSFAEACIRLLKDTRLAADMGRAARSVVSNHYSRGQVVNAISMYMNYSRPQDHVPIGITEKPREGEAALCQK